MSGTIVCAWCGSVDTQQGFDQALCVACGLFTAATGEKTVPTSQANEGVTVADITPPPPAATAPEQDVPVEPFPAEPAPADPALEAPSDATL